MVKTWVPRYLPVQEEFKNLCNSHDKTEVMAVCSRDSETVVRDQFFFYGFCLFLW